MQILSVESFEYAVMIRLICCVSFGSMAPAVAFGVSRIFEGQGAEGGISRATEVNAVAGKSYRQHLKG